MKDPELNPRREELHGEPWWVSLLMLVVFASLALGCIVLERAASFFRGGRK